MGTDPPLHAQPCRGVARMRPRSAQVRERPVDVFGTSEEVIVALMLQRHIERLRLVLYAVRPQFTFEVDAGIPFLIRRKLNPGLEAAEFRALVLNRVRRALVESRSAVCAEADVREDVA